ncbi:MAG: DUF4347 domain-containing protein [Synechococcales bacterium]|nr:DUF4347 domain-containing protein [Synechococcales bacterium]
MNTIPKVSPHSSWRSTNTSASLFSSTIASDSLLNPISYSLNHSMIGLSRSLLFIDSSVSDAHTLALKLTQAHAVDTEVHFLQADQDAIAQITQILQGRQGIDSLHLVSHGRSGGLQLGQSWLAAETLSNYSAQLQSWGNAFTENADVFLYGCQVAEGNTGQTFVNLLAQSTGADVAASDDLTGNASLGGNWNLEFQTGAIEAVALQAIDYQHTLLSFSSQDFSTSGSWLSVVEDVNRDNKLDFIQASSQTVNGTTVSTIVTYLGDGAGGFTPTNSPLILASSGLSNIRVGEMTGDDKLDLVTTRSLPGSPFHFVEVHAGDGAGGFSTVQESASSISASPRSLRLADVDNDGKLNILTVNFNRQNVYVWLRNVGITQYQVGPDPLDLAVGDFNQDNKLDFVTTSPTANNILIHLGDGNGNFTAQAPIPMGTAPSMIALGDVDGNGKLDILTANVSNNVSVLLGTGGGNFSAPTTIAIGNRPSQISLGDMNGDGMLDIVTSNNVSNDVSIVLGDGRGNFAGGITVGVGANPGSLNLGDFNRDGKLDFMTSSDSGLVSVRLNDMPRLKVEALTNPTEGEIAKFRLTLDRPAPEGFTVNFQLQGTATLGQDYQLSLDRSEQILNLTNNQLTWNAGSLTATIALQTVRDDVFDPNETIALNLLNGDYFLDNTQKQASLTIAERPLTSILWQNSQTNALRLWQLKGLQDVGYTVDIDKPITFLGQAVIPGREWQLRTFADFNADGHPDYVWKRQGTDQVVIWFMQNEVINSVANVTDAAGNTIKTGANWNIIAADQFNGVNSPKSLLWQDSSTGELALWQLNQQYQVSRGDFVQFMGSRILPGASWNVKLAKDFNGDGKIEVLWHNAVTGDVAIWTLNGSSIQFHQILHQGVPQGWEILTATRYNNDNQHDIVWRNPSTGEASVWYLKSDFTLDSSSTVSPAIPGTTQILEDVNDFDNDGNIDQLWFDRSNSFAHIIRPSRLSGSGRRVSLVPGLGDPNWEVAFSMS